jgi:UDPglucose 6-dehydrogenase
MNVGIVGHGVVGSALKRWLAQTAEHQVVIYDKFQLEYKSESTRLKINECDLVFLCVPTPIGSDGLSCDTSAVEECVAWITAPLCIKSTVPPGTTDRLSKAKTQAIAFSPEYIGESFDHPWPDEGNTGFCIIGGPECIYEKIKQLYDSLSVKQTRFYRTTARAAELCKYMENCFLATKVAFVNQFFRCRLGRSAWPMVGRSAHRRISYKGYRGARIWRPLFP